MTVSAIIANIRGLFPEQMTESTVIRRIIAKDPSLTGKNRKEEKKMQSKKTAEAKEAKEAAREYLDVTSYEILRAKEGQGGRVWVDMKINGIALYGFQVVPRKDGSGDFLAWPSYKGSDGKYYNSAFAFFRQETEKSLLAAIQEFIDK